MRKSSVEISMKSELEFFGYFALQAFKKLLSIFDFLLDLLFGYKILSGSRQERIKAKDYSCSAQIVNVWGRVRFHALQATDLTNYLYTHEKYVHPNYILENDNVNLTSVTKVRIGNFNNIQLRVI